jgi:hypothetical protein
MHNQRDHDDQEIIQHKVETRAKKSACTPIRFETRGTKNPLGQKVLMTAISMLGTKNPGGAKKLGDKNAEYSCDGVTLLTLFTILVLLFWPKKK